MIGYDEHAKVSSARQIGASKDEQTAVFSLKYHRRGYQFAKRLVDILISGVALIVLLPVFLVITVVIAIQDGFPVAFRQKRVGHHGDAFDIFKFRTMVKNAEEVLRSRPDLMEEYRIYYKIQNDPRILPCGKFLRKSSLDELPQLLNVLMGNMSLVGPRPIVPPELEKYGDEQQMYISMKPGCAGLWQCSGRSTTTYEERVAMDREYFEKASIWMDFSILFRTVGAIWTGRGAR